MAKKMKKTNPGEKKSHADAYQLKITLWGTKPPIWRRVIVPSDINLYKLHAVIQVAMGWEDAHLHHFEIDGQFYQGPAPDGSMFDDGTDSENETKFSLCDVVHREKAKFRYQYDFGDSWDHLMLLEKIIPAAEKPKTMVCTAGKGHCPMEDSGGIWGYYHMLEILADPKNPEYAEISDWLGGPFDPDEFDLDEVNKELAKLRRK